MPENNRPTHELKLLDPQTGDRSQVGVAWAKEDGHISIKLNVGVILSYDTVKDKHLTLFKTKTQEEWEALKLQQREQRTAEFREKYGEYVRKIHFSPATQNDCPNRFLGNPTLTDDPEKVTCIKCKKLIRAMQRGSQLPPTPTT